MKKVENLRKKINQIDLKILNLLNRRAEIAKQIGLIKTSKGYQIYSPEREKEIVQKMLKYNTGPLNEEDVKEIFYLIIQICRYQQKKFQKKNIWI
jgi:chorismate mutase-like protein